MSQIDRQAIAGQLLTLLHERGQIAYSLEVVSHYEHAMQSGLLAEQAGASSALVVASLLHDLGYLVNAQGEAMAGRGVDTLHERIAEKYLQRWFGQDVTAPIGLHVLAKRYLCAVEPAYFDGLSPVSVESLRLQGGPMTEQQTKEFLTMPHALDAVALRRWDDEAKVVGMALPPVEHFARHIDAALLK